MSSASPYSQPTGTEISGTASQSPGSISKISSPGDSSESSSAFKSFWKRSDKKSQDVTFVQQDPSGVGKRKTSRLSKIFGGGKKDTSSEDGTPSDSGKTEAQKRRAQVYQAQKRHRNRKAEYVNSLEAEVAKWQQLDSQANAEKNALLRQNEAIKAFLASQSLDSKFEQFNISSQPQPASIPRGSNGDIGTAWLDVRDDPIIGGHERTFFDFDGMEDITWTSSDVSQSQSDGQAQALSPPRQPIKGDSAAALDFILALEWPCQGHINHHSIHPATPPAKPTKPDPEACHGHALTVTKTVYEMALPSNSNGREPNTPAQNLASNTAQSQKWQLPHSEIDKLIELSTQLPIDDFELTPAQAYAAIRNTVPSEDLLRPALDALKAPLSALIGCQGFGATMPADAFWQHVDTTIQKLPSPSPQYVLPPVEATSGFT